MKKLLQLGGLIFATVIVLRMSVYLFEMPLLGAKHIPLNEDVVGIWLVPATWENMFFLFASGLLGFIGILGIVAIIAILKAGVNRHSPQRRN